MITYFMSVLLLSKCFRVCVQNWVVYWKEYFSCTLYIYIYIIMNYYTQHSLFDVLGAGNRQKRKLEEMDDCAIEPPAKIHHP